MERLWNLATESAMSQSSPRRQPPRLLARVLGDGIGAMSPGQLAKATRLAERAPGVQRFRSLGERRGELVRASGTVRLREPAALGPGSEAACSWRRTLLEVRLRREVPPILGWLGGGRDSVVPLVHDAAQDFDLVDDEGAAIRVEVEGAFLLTPATPPTDALGPEGQARLAAILPAPLVGLLLGARFAEVLVRDGETVLAIGTAASDALTSAGGALVVIPTAAAR